MPRVAIAGFLHESNTFLDVPTTIEAFRETSWTEGADVLRRWSGAHHELGGIVDALADEGIEPVPLLATFAVPSGALTAETFDAIAGTIEGKLRAALAVDGVLLALHGATVAENHRDADGEILRQVRRVVGRSVPIIATLDLHANISRAMAENSNALICYQTNPHLDQRARGIEAARLMGATLRGAMSPVQRLETPPWIIPIQSQHTGQPPAAALAAIREDAHKRYGLLSASAALGFYYADVKEMGASFLAVADGDAGAAREAACEMAQRAWERREEFAQPLPSPAEAVRRAAQAELTPVALYDVGDNVGGGAPADSTVLFEEILKQGGPDALVVLYDPEAVQACVRAGVRHQVELQAGGKTDARHGQPVALCGRVRAMTDGRFVEREVRHGGWGENDQGLTAVLETAERHTVILTSKRMAPMSLQQILSAGVEPRTKRILVVKGVVAPRAAYDPICAETILVDTPGVTAADPARFTYRHARPSLFPVDPAAAYQPGG